MARSLIRYSEREYNTLFLHIWVSFFTAAVFATCLYGKFQGLYNEVYSERQTDGITTAHFNDNGIQYTPEFKLTLGN